MSFCHGSSLQSSTNYRANKELFEVSEGASIKELFEVSEGTSVKRSGATVQLLTLINNHRSVSEPQRIGRIQRKHELLIALKEATDL